MVRPLSCYLAGPIDLADQETRVGWQNAAKNILGHYGVSVYAPYFIAHHNPEVKQQIMSIGFHTVEQASMVLAYLPHDVPTLGTIREIHHATTLGKRVVVASPWAGTSAFSADLEVHETLWEALCAILEITEEELIELISVIYGPNAHFFDYVPNGGSNGGRDSDREPDPRPVTHRRVPHHKDEFTRRT